MIISFSSFYTRALFVLSSSDLLSSSQKKIPKSFFLFSLLRHENHCNVFVCKIYKSMTHLIIDWYTISVRPLLPCNIHRQNYPKYTSYNSTVQTLSLSLSLSLSLEYLHLYFNIILTDRIDLDCNTLARSFVVVMFYFAFTRKHNESLLTGQFGRKCLFEVICFG